MNKVLKPALIVYRRLCSNGRKGTSGRTPMKMDLVVALEDVVAADAIEHIDNILVLVEKEYDKKFAAG